MLALAAPRIESEWHPGGSERSQDFADPGFQGNRFVDGIAHSIYCDAETDLLPDQLIRSMRVTANCPSNFSAVNLILSPAFT